jgi:hypothetical protein
LSRVQEDEEMRMVDGLVVNKSFVFALKQHELMKKGHSEEEAFKLAEAALVEEENLALKKVREAAVSLATPHALRGIPREATWPVVLTSSVPVWQLNELTAEARKLGAVPAMSSIDAEDDRWERFQVRLQRLCLTLRTRTGERSDLGRRLQLPLMHHPTHVTPDLGMMSEFPRPLTPTALPQFWREQLRQSPYEVWPRGKRASLDHWLARSVLEWQPHQTRYLGKQAFAEGLRVVRETVFADVLQPFYQAAVRRQS